MKSNMLTWFLNFAIPVEETPELTFVGGRIQVSPVVSLCVFASAGIT